MRDSAAAPDDRTQTAREAFLTGAPDCRLTEDRYLVCFAQTLDELHAAQRLRYEVFNVELGEGLDSSHLTRRDEDPFDAGCHHLLVIDTRTDTIIGTYRMQTPEMATRHRGFYSDGEFEVPMLGDEILSESIEVGRACIAPAHRKQRVLFALWRGLAAYVNATGKRYVFGCCSLTSRDPWDGAATMERLRRDGHVFEGTLVRARPGFECVAPPPSDAAVAGVKIPPLFGTYLRFDSLVYSEPAVDHAFKTIDWLVVMDTRRLDPRSRATFGLDA
ncbi:MAG: GNAT family N-acetyltransferase [Planctomycetes bacterium]|nr:GNAT family N-acetyltransferase [Planctomycetota bacterium]